MDLSLDLPLHGERIAVASIWGWVLIYTIFQQLLQTIHPLPLLVSKLVAIFVGMHDQTYSRILLAATCLDILQTRQWHQQNPSCKTGTLPKWNRLPAIVSLSEQE